MQSAFAQEDPSVSYLGIEQGLSNNSVTCIFRDYGGETAPRGTQRLVGVGNRECRFFGAIFKISPVPMDRQIAMRHIDLFCAIAIDAE
jgi:hypothetical protein